jgi:hypothetical protein
MLLLAGAALLKINGQVASPVDDHVEERQHQAPGIRPDCRGKRKVA